jgi:hypothetical protein
MIPCHHYDIKVEFKQLGQGLVGKFNLLNLPIEVPILPSAVGGLEMNEDKIMIFHSRSGQTNATFDCVLGRKHGHPDGTRNTTVHRIGSNSGGLDTVQLGERRQWNVLIKAPQENTVSDLLA